jgi:putative DNA primase/helicase
MLNISTESGRDVNPNILKQLTSGERVTVKRLYVDPRETNDYGKVLAAFNDLPRAENTFGYFRRLLILAYQVTIPQEEVDRRLADKLKTELPGILNWVLQALPGLMTRGEFTQSQNCEHALERYRLMSDNVLLFANEMCDPYEYTTNGQEIYAAYRSYCLESSLKHTGKQKFYERLSSVFPREDFGNIVCFRLKLTAS